MDVARVGQCPDEDKPFGVGAFVRRDVVARELDGEGLSFSEASWSVHRIAQRAIDVDGAGGILTGMKIGVG